MTLSRKNRFTKHTFPKKGKLFSSEHLSFKEVPTTPHQKFSIVVSSRVVSTANKRNLIRRRVSEAIQKIKNNKSGVFYVRKGADRLSFKEIKEEVFGLLKS